MKIFEKSSNIQKINSNIYIGASLRGLILPWFEKLVNMLNRNSQLIEKSVYMLLVVYICHLFETVFKVPLKPSRYVSYFIIDIDVIRLFFMLVQSSKMVIYHINLNCSFLKIFKLNYFYEYYILYGDNLCRSVL